MYDPLDDDLIIQATQLFNDAVATEGLVIERATELAQAMESDMPNKKEYFYEFCHKSAKITNMARTSIVIAVHFQHILEDYQKFASKRKSKKGFKDL